MRKSVMLDSEEFWDQISINYMTEESDDEADQSQLVLRRIPWRSKCKGINVMSGMHFYIPKPMYYCIAGNFCKLANLETAKF